MANSLYPAFVRLFYQSNFSPHTMTIPTRAWIDPNDPDESGGYINWNGDGIVAADMINALVDDLVDLMDETSAFNSYIIYTLASPTAPPIIRRVYPLTDVGTVSDSFQVKATQHTFSMLDTEGAKMKLVLLDAPVQAGYEPVKTLATLSAAEQAVIGDLLTPDAAWSSRNGARPATFRRKTVKLNDKLRRAYHMD